MNEIYQGDNGTLLNLTITNDDSVIDLTDSTVEVVIKYKRTGIKKEATITDATNGKCQITLNAEDVNYEGVYSLQGTVTYLNGNTFTSNVQRFVVNKKIGYVPIIGGTTGDVGDSSINGNIIINGQDIKVYDDTTLKQDISTLKNNDLVTNNSINNINTSLSSNSIDINDLKNNKHNHTNLSTLNQLSTDGINLLFNGAKIVSGSAINTSVINGYIKVDGVDLKVFDATSLQNQLQDALNRISVLEGGISQPVNTAPSISSNYNVTTINDSTSISIPYTVTDSEGGSLTVTYTKDGVSNTATISTGSNTWNVGTLSTGSHTLSIQVKDSGNLTSNTLTFNLTVSVTNTAPIISSTYSVTSINDSTSVSIPYTITDAQGGVLTATYTKDGVNSTASVSTGANTWSVGTLPVGSHTLTIKVADNGGLNSNTLTFNITVIASADTTAPTDISGLSAGTATINSIPVSWTLSPSGDVANYEVAYSSNGGTNWTVASALVNSSSTSYNITGLVAGTNYTIRVVAIDTSSNRSTGITITKSTAASVNYVLSATPSTGSYNTTQNVVLSTNPAGATVYYTTNGTTPTTTSSIYSTAIPVSANTTIKFFAQDGIGNVSSVQTATYTIDNVAPTVTVTPNAGTYGSAQTVTITTNEGTIYYTVNGATPTIASPVYSTSFSVSSASTVKYLVVDAAGNQTTGSVVYTIDTVAPDPVTALNVGTVTSNSIPITWTAPLATDVSKYEVTYSSDGGTTYNIATSNLTAPATSYTVTGLTASTSYIVRVVAIDGVGNRSTPMTVSVTTSTQSSLIAVTGVTLDKSTASIDQNTTLQLTATIAPINATNKNVTWSSSNNSIATVDNSGLVTGVGVGVVTITVTTEEGSFTATCNLSVNQIIVGFDYNNLTAYPDNSTVTFDKTVNGQSDWVHPSVLYFENGWQGHKWWMGVSPYPDTIGTYENTYLYYSDDGDNWKTPTGITGTVFPLKTGFNNNSDPNLFMNYDGVTMHLLNRAVYSGTPGTGANPASTSSSSSIIEIISSTDGINWTQRQTIIDTANTGYDIVAPCVAKYNGKYYMFAQDVADQSHITVLEAITPTGIWTEINRISTGTLGSLWHAEVRYINSEFIVIASTGSQQGGNLMLGKFNTPMDTTVIGRNNAFVAPPNISGSPWTTSCYKSSLVYKNDNDIEIFIGFKGSGLSSSTDWRVSRCKANRIIQTLDLSGYQEVTGIATTANSTAPVADYYKYVYDVTIDTIDTRPYAFGDSTNQYANLKINNGILYAEIWVGGTGSKTIPISYGISVNDRVTMVYENDIKFYINGRLIYTFTGASDQYAPLLLTNRGRQYGALAGSVSNIKLYKKPEYFYSVANSITYKDTAKTDTNNVILADEFNRANGVLNTSDNGVIYAQDSQFYGTPTISSNALVPSGADGAVLMPTEGNYQLLWSSASYLWGIYLSYTDVNNYVKIIPNEFSKGKRILRVRNAGTNTDTQLISLGNEYDKHANWRLDVIDGYGYIYMDNVYTNRFQIPANSFNKYVGVTGYFATTAIDYFVVKQLDSVLPVVRLTTDRTFTDSQTVSISTNGIGTKIYYTLDGTTPTTLSSLYTTPLSLTNSTTVKAISVSADGTQTSAVKTAIYTKVVSTLLVNDDFNRADTTTSATGLGSTLTGQTWTATPATTATASVQVLSNEAKLTATGEFIIDTSKPNGELQVKLSTASSVPQSNILARYIDDSNNLLIKVYAGNIELWSKVSGTSTKLQGVSVTNVDGQIIKVQLNKYNIKVLINDVVKINVDSSYNMTGTKFGISGVANSRYDDFKFTSNI